MDKSRGVLCRVQALCLIVILGACASVSAGFLGFGGDSWKEEVLLHDGSKMVVERMVERGGRHEIGQKPPYKEQSLSFVFPGTNQTIKWEDHYGEDIGTANFLPMALDVSGGTPYLVVHPMGCLSYNKWGRPNPPYVIFRYQEKEWGRIPLSALPADITRPNLIFSMPDVEVERLGTRFVSSEKIRQLITGYQSPEYKAILREPVEGLGRQCGEMVYAGKSRWIGKGWFRDQPSRSACLKYCEKEKVPIQYCPCAALFREE